MFELPPEVKVITMPYRKARQNIAYLRRYLKCHKVNYLIIESELYAMSVGIAITFLNNKYLPQISQVIHGTIYPISGSYLKILKQQIKFWFFHRRFHSILFVCKRSEIEIKKLMRFVPRIKTATVNNACCDDLFWSLTELPAKHPWLVKKIYPTFVAAGSYTYGKRFKLLIEAFRIIKNNYKMHLRIVIFGRGQEEEMYKSIIKKYVLDDYVSIGGFTDQLPAEIKASDGLISASFEESFGITIVEGLACGVPVLAADAPWGPREILADGKYGRLVPVDNVNAMAEAIIDLAYGKIPVASSESWERYTIHKILKKYCDAMGI